MPDACGDAKQVVGRRRGCCCCCYDGRGGGLRNLAPPCFGIATKCRRIRPSLTPPLSPPEADCRGVARIAHPPAAWDGVYTFANK